METFITDVQRTGVFLSTLILDFIAFCRYWRRGCNWFNLIFIFSIFLYFKMIKVCPGYFRWRWLSLTRKCFLNAVVLEKVFTVAINYMLSYISKDFPLIYRTVKILDDPLIHEGFIYTFLTLRWTRNESIYLQCSLLYYWAAAQAEKHGCWSPWFPSLPVGLCWMLHFPMNKPWEVNIRFLFRCEYEQYKHIFCFLLVSMWVSFLSYKVVFKGVLSEDLSCQCFQNCRVRD